MAYEQREGQGSLFRNDKKNERQPDFKGTIMIKGVLYNISAWNRTSQNGREYMSLQAEEKTDVERAPRGQQGGYSPRPNNHSSDYASVPAPTANDMPAVPEGIEDLPF